METATKADDLYSFVDIDEKDGAANHDNTTTLHYAKENNATARRAKKIEFILRPEETVCRMSKLEWLS